MHINVSRCDAWGNVTFRLKRENVSSRSTYAFQHFESGTC